MKKILFCATVQSHILNFHLPYLQYFQSQGYEVHVACNGDGNIPYCDMFHAVPFERNPFQKANIDAYRRMKMIMQVHSFSLIHCHTPMGAAITRLAARKSRKSGTAVLYTAHGFHFFKGAPLKNWLMYFPIEWALSFFTDTLITINQEDYTRAKKCFHAKQIVFVPGVGIDKSRFFRQNDTKKRDEMRRLLGISPQDFMLVYVAELIARKNQLELIRAIQKTKQNAPNVRLLLVGTGEKAAEYQQAIRDMQLENEAILMGWRSDIPEILSAADGYIAVAKHEGLAINLIEAMASRLPIIATNVRGQRDLIQNGETGYLIANDEKEMVKAIETLMTQPAQNDCLSKNAWQASEKYALEAVMPLMKEMYEQALRASEKRS